MKSLFKNSFLIISILSLISINTFGQRLSDINAIRNAERQGITRMDAATLDTTSQGKKAFLKFYIPSAILFSGLEPAAISKINLSFGDDKIDFKVGKLIKKQEANDNLNSSIGFTASAAAPTGARSLFQFDKTPRDYSGTVTATFITKHLVPYIIVGADTIQTARKANWLNVNARLGNTKKLLFKNDFDYSENHYTDFNIMVNYNHFYNSWYPKSSLSKRAIWSVGVGAGNFDNYTDLDDYTLRKGVYHETEQSFGEINSVVGKKGILDRDFGLLLSASAFKPISRFDATTSVMLGININSFGLGASDSKLNGNAGVYISKRSFEEDSGNQELKEDFSFGILADFSNLTNSNSAYFKDNFRLLITAQIPLRFFH